MKKIYYLGILALLMCGCEQEKITGGDILYPVSFSLPAVEAVSRAAEGTLSDGTTLTVAAYNNAGTLAAQCAYKVSGTSLTPATTGAKMYLSAGTYNFCTISPAQTLSDDGKSATIAKDVDVLGSVTRALMLSEETAIKLDDLSHLASQIRFTFRLVKTNTDQAVFKVRKVTIGNMVMSYNNNLQLPENRLGIPAITETDKYGALEITNTDNSPTFDYHKTRPSGYVTGSHYNIQKDPLLVFPRGADAFKVSVEIEAGTSAESATTKKYSATISRVAFDPGRQYHFIVNFGWDFMDFMVTVSDWDARDNGQGNVGSGEQEISSSFTVDEWGTPVDLGGNLGGE